MFGVVVGSSELLRRIGQVLEASAIEFPFSETKGQKAVIEGNLMVTHRNVAH